MESRTCPQNHPLTGANVYTDTKTGYKQCKTCRRERMRDRRQVLPRVGQGGVNAAKTHCPKGHEYTSDNTARTKKGSRACRACARIRLRKVVITQYGITVEQFEQMLVTQSGRCAICSIILLDPHIDHDHSCCLGRKACGKCVRSLLCKDCNIMLGMAKDSIKILQSAVNYLTTPIINR
jgi:hypothetical protein